jgi:hypothetical protein
MILYALIKILKGFHGKPLKHKKAKRLIFYNSHCYAIQNQFSRPMFDGLTQNFVTGSII